MPVVAFEMRTALPPERVLAMLTDFSPRRPDLWPTLAPELYEVYEVQPTCADVKEGSPSPTRMWEQAHYDWSVPGCVRWTVRESNFFAPGSYTEVTVRSSTKAGSELHVESNRTGVGLAAKILIGLNALTGGSFLKTAVFQRAFDQEFRRRSASAI